MSSSVETQSMAPAKSDPMERVNVRLPQATVEQLSQLGADQGKDLSAVIRDAIDEGLPLLLARASAKLDHENKTLVNRKLKMRLEGADEALTLLRSGGNIEEAIALLSKAIQ